ncbi:PEP-CTERM sorting domain-containing protein [Luteolibacter flavescens]|uniref:PEP-CTERM sorting domain-containing protein n=1 Tax=Luteolibacter flavescens TaxID=1859460 RepID=A0ABT3FKU4_9BACT|nr:PEP-CTERM sorting domain-containing protein [Luteolibacter flavescens]MCW1884187.1 PEP-CTERM sorting domain-containing protein [Luteolibacter flavescens]
MKSSASPALRAVLVSLTLLPAATQAATVVWSGADGQYLTPENWVGGVLPNTAAGDTALITSGDVIYTAGSDLTVSNGGQLVIAGGSWTQVGANSWLQLAGGSLIVAGGTFNQGTSGNIARHSGTTITVTSGVANFTGDLTTDPAAGNFNFTGGTINLGGEFKPIETFTMTGGELNAALVSFSDGDGTLFFEGGRISVNGAGPYGGFYGGGGAKALDFSSGSSGQLYFRNYSIADLTSDGFMTNGTIQYEGAIAPTAFNVVETGGGVLVTVIPEPSTAMSLLGGLGTLLMVRRRRSA